MMIKLLILFLSKPDDNTNLKYRIYFDDPTSLEFKFSFRKKNTIEFPTVGKKKPIGQNSATFQLVHSLMIIWWGKKMGQVTGSHLCQFFVAVVPSHQLSDPTHMSITMR